MLTSGYWRTRGAATQASSALALVAVAGFADWLLGPDVPLTLGYLVPIALAAWCFRRSIALACTVVASTTWLIIELLEHEVSLHLGVHILNFSLQFGLFLAFGRLVFALRDRLLREQQLAYSDSLTGLANRRAFWVALEQEVRRSRRFGAPFSIAYVDVDEFKSINDRCGHECGDQVLQRIGRAIRTSVREVDVAARIGGDEFAVLMPGTPDAGARVVTAKIARVLEAAGLLPGQGVRCSIGCLSVDSAPGSVDELMSRADALMYAAKRRGDGQAQHETISVPADARERLTRAGS